MGSNLFETSLPAGGFDYARFSDPPALDRLVPFLSWNERMEPEALRQQVDECAAAGWGGVFVHSRIGLTTPYLGEEWFAAVAATLDQARRRGLKVWLYDEDKWPSGYSGGSVPLADPAFRLQTLIARPAGGPVPADCEPLGGVEDGLQLYVWTSPLGHDWFNGTSYAGLMHRGAMRQFLQDAYAPYHARFAADYGTTIVGQFTDEPCPIFRIRLPHGSVPYTPELLERLRALEGADVLPRLVLLWREGAGAARLRLQYFRTAGRLFEEHFTGQLAGWCAAHGIALTGHYMAEDDLLGQVAWAVRIMPNYRHQHIPGIDHLTRHVGHALTAKQCQSVVNQFGKPRMLSELYGVSGGSLSFADRLWIGAEQVALGVNLLNPHLALYTMAGCRKRDYPQNIFYQQPWWPLNKVVDEPLARLCAAMAQGVYHTEVLLLHPLESALALWQAPLDAKLLEGLVPWDHNPATPEATEAIRALEREFLAVLDALLASQRGFDLGDEQILAEDGALEHGAAGARLRVGRMRYRVVVLPGLATLARTTLELLRGFAAAGGVVLVAGRRPELIDGEPDAAAAAWLAGLPETAAGALDAALERHAPAVLRVAGVAPELRRSLLAHVRDLADGARLVLLVNLHREQALAPVLTCGGGFRGAEWLDFLSGRAEALAVEAGAEEMSLELELPPGQARLLLLHREPKPGTGRLTHPPAAETRGLDAAAWRVERLDANALTLDYARWQIGGGAWTRRPAPVIGLQQYLNSVRFDGAVALEFSFEVEAWTPGRHLELVLEHPERYAVRVNEQPVAYAGRPAWRDLRWLPLDIAPRVRPGVNVIRLDCAHFQHGDLTRVEDAFGRYGTELEAVYLVGDFSVAATPVPEQPVAEHWARFGLPPVGVRCIAAPFVLADPAPLRWGDVTGQGLPFYAGRLRLATRLPEALEPGRWKLVLERLDAPVAEVALAGRGVGCLWGAPLEVALNSPGEPPPAGAELELTLYSTLRNLLGPHHHPEGELASVGPHSFVPLSSLGTEGANEWALRHAAGSPPEDWADRYCLTTLGEVGTVRLVREG